MSPPVDFGSSDPAAAYAWSIERQQQQQLDQLERIRLQQRQEQQLADLQHLQQEHINEQAIDAMEQTTAAANQEDPTLQSPVVTHDQDPAHNPEVDSVFAQAGESLADIARSRGLDLAAVTRLNPQIEDPQAALAENQGVLVPRASSSSASTSSDPASGPAMKPYNQWVDPKTWVADSSPYGVTLAGFSPENHSFVTPEQLLTDPLQAKYLVYNYLLTHQVQPYATDANGKTLMDPATGKPIPNNVTGYDWAHKAADDLNRLTHSDLFHAEDAETLWYGDEYVHSAPNGHGLPPGTYNASNGGEFLWGGTDGYIKFPSSVTLGQTTGYVPNGSPGHGGDPHRTGGVGGHGGGHTSATSSTSSTSGVGSDVRPITDDMIRQLIADDTHMAYGPDATPDYQYWLPKMRADKSHLEYWHRRVLGWQAGGADVPSSGPYARGGAGDNDPRSKLPSTFDNTGQK